MTFSPADLLKVLNALRIAKGQNPLKSWKESKAKLIDRVINLHVEIYGDETVTLGEIMSADGGEIPFDDNDDNDDNNEDEAPEATETQEAPTFTLAELARELNIDPKVARAKMRRTKIDDFMLVEGKKHSFKNSTSIRAFVINVLTGDRRKKDA